MPAPSRLISAVARLVEASRRNAALLSILVLLGAVFAGFEVARHASIDTDTSNLISADSPWRKAAAEMDQAFPRNKDLLAIVIDGATPDQTADAATAMAARLNAHPELFRDVRDPEGSRFFRENGLLFLSRGEVQKFADSIITAQPMLGELGADPSPRGVFDALDLFSQGTIRGETAPDALDRPFSAVARALDATLAGQYAPLSWQNLLSDRAPSPRELRRFVLARPALNFGAVEPGHLAVAAIQTEARSEGLEPERGVRVRVTGPVALADDQLAALSDGAGATAALSVGLLVLWLYLAMRSVRTVLAILATLLVGLVACAAFAVGAVGPFNPISVAFAPLFIGIAIDFGIQFGVRYADERRHGGAAEALRKTALGVGAPLLVAGAATAAGFFSLFPTDYRGVADLGLIAGAGMLIALVLNLTLLPALLSLFRAGGLGEAAGFPWASRVDDFLVRRRRLVFAAAGLLAVLSALELQKLRFDFDPINLENPAAESVQTLFDLMRDPDTTPYTLDVLAPSAAAASGLALRLGNLPEVRQVIWLGSLVPADQEEKLAILEDARTLLDPAWSSVSPKAPPGIDGIRAAAARCAADVGKLADRGDPAAAQLVAALHRLAGRGTDILPALDANISDGAVRRLGDFRAALKASRVTMDSIPEEVRSDWVSSDGRYRIEVYPKGDGREGRVLKDFVSAVQREAPGAAGMPVDIRESARTVTGAFATAGVLAVIAIALLLFAVLRRPGEIAAVLVPLLLAGLLTMATSALVGMPLNFANIVTLPLLLGIGVAFDIYFVLRWRSGEAGLLRSPTARGVVFSALTTGTAFGSLILSKSPGMAAMGKLLSLGLFFTLVCTLLFLPAFLGPPRPPAGERGTG